MVILIKINWLFNVKLFLLIKKKIKFYIHELVGNL